MNVAEWTVDYFLANEAQCLEELRNGFAGIPMLNQIPYEKVKSGTLIRYRGFIQDMMDPEFYLEQYSVSSKDKSTRVQCGKLRDSIVYKNEEEYLVHDSDDSKHGERRTMFVLSIPGLNKWVEDYEKENYSRQPGDDLQISPNAAPKRPLSEDEEMETDHLLSPEPESVKKVKCEEEKSVEGVSKEYLLNYPIPDRPSKVCMVKIYNDFDKYKLNSVIDVIGFLSMDPGLDGTNDKLSEFEEMEQHISNNPPPSLIPRIHAVHITEINHFNPLLENEFVWDPKDVHKDILMCLKQCLFGDEVAAHYLLSHLLSSIYARIDIEILGRCSLNLSNLPVEVIGTEYLSKLYEILEFLLPASHYFPLTLDNLNTLDFVPVKDFKTNRLRSGLLQLAPKTHLVLDETRLEVGQLQAHGIAAVNSISNLISNQIVKFDFKYFQLDFEADIPVLVFSEGKSILPSDFHVPINPDPASISIIFETLTAAKQFVKNHAVEMRKFLTAQKVNQFTITPEVQEVIQNDLVQMRREMNLVSDDFHLFLNLSRLVGKSLGKTSVDSDVWNTVKKLELERRTRIEGLPKRGTKKQSET